jgi:hypothetical protein
MAVNPAGTHGARMSCSRDVPYTGVECTDVTVCPRRIDSDLAWD